MMLDEWEKHKTFLLVTRTETWLSFMVLRQNNSNALFEGISSDFPSISLRRQFGTLKRGEHSKYSPMAFTEQGVAMLSSVLNSQRAIDVNILIMRAFLRLREMVSSHRDLLRRVEEMERKYDRQFQVVFEAIKQLMAEPEKPKKRIGFEVKEPRVRYGKK